MLLIDPRKVQSIAPAFLGLAAIFWSGLAHPSTVLTGGYFKLECLAAVGAFERSCVKGYSYGESDDDLREKAAKDACGRDARSGSAVCDTFAALSSFRVTKEDFRNCVKSHDGLTPRAPGDLLYRTPTISRDIRNCGVFSFEKLTQGDAEHRLNVCKADLSKAMSWLDRVHLTGAVSENQFKSLSEAITDIQSHTEAGGSGSNSNASLAK
jgi:hypothetical protein